jgi:hypothetical protein
MRLLASATEVPAFALLKVVVQDAALRTTLGPRLRQAGAMLARQTSASTQCVLARCFKVAF